MTTQTQFLKRLVTCFDELNVPYVVVGSVASSVHGEPRSTNDLDIIIRVSESQLGHLVARLKESFYVSDEAARQAFKNRTLFNVMDVEYSWKAELIIHDFTSFEAIKF